MFGIAERRGFTRKPAARRAEGQRATQLGPEPAKKAVSGGAPKCHSRRRTPVWESQSRTMLPPGGGPPLAIITPLVVTTQFPFGLKAAAVTSSLCASRSGLPLLASNRSACWPAMRSDRSPILDGAIRVIGKPSLPSSATAEPDATFQPLHWPALRMPITEPSAATVTSFSPSGRPA